MCFKTLSLIVLSLTLSACNITGSSQKGPFQSGSTVTASQLNAQGNPIASTTLVTQVFGSQGDFSVDRIRWSGWTELTVTGQYFDEFSNSASSGALSLNAITRKDRRFDVANINLYTHLAAARIKQRILNGQNRNNAWRDTQTEMIQLFDLSRVSRNFNQGVEQLDLLSGNGRYRSDNANLLLFTGAFLASENAETNLTALTEDFSDDGAFNGVGVSTFEAIASKASEDGLLQSLSNNLQANGANNPPNTGDMNQLPSWVNTDVVVDTVPPVISITGQEEITLVVGTPFVDEGATANDIVDGPVPANAVDGSDIIDTSVIGTNIITYSAVDLSGNESTAIRTVIIVEEDDETPPELILLGDDPDNVEVDVSGESSYEDPGYTVTDNRDEEVNVVVEGINAIDLSDLDGPFTITYTATDAAENSVSIDRIVNVVDTESPVITLIDGEVPHNILVDNNEVPEPYDDPGATVEDNYNVELSYTLDLSGLDRAIPGEYTITYNAADSSSNAADPVERTVIVSALPNQAPTVNAGEDSSVIVNTAITLNGTANDADGSIESYRWTDENDNELATSASFVFTPTTVGSQELTLTVTDDNGATASDTMVVNVGLPASYQILLASDSIGIPKNSSLTELNAALLANVSVVDSSGNVIDAQLTFDSTVVDLSTPITYQVLFSYTDPFERTITQTVSVVVFNRSPIAEAQEIEVAEDSSNTAITLGGSDPDGDDIVFLVLSMNTTNGTLSGTPPNLTYTPNANFNGLDNIEFVVGDGDSSSQASVSILVTAVNDAPVASPQSVTFDEDSTNNTIILAASDVDGDSLFFTTTMPTNGTLGGSATNITYTPKANFSGSDSFSFTVSDGIASLTETININVTEINDAPVAEAQTIEVDEDSGATSILLTATDIDSEALTYTNTVINSATGTLTGTAPNLTFIPSENFSGTDSFTFTVNDGSEASTATVSILVTAVNDAPVAIAQSIDVEEDSGAISVLLTATDIDSEALTYTNTGINSATGTLTGTAPNLTFTPTENFFGEDSFDFTVSDGNSQSTATVTITVSDVDEPNIDPTVEIDVGGIALVNDSITVTSGDLIPLTAIANDIDGEVVTYSWQVLEGSIVSTSQAFEFDTAIYGVSNVVLLLTVIDEDGGSASDSLTIVIEPLETAPTTITVSFDTPLSIEAGEYPDEQDLYDYIEDQITIRDSFGNEYEGDADEVELSIEGYTGDDFFFNTLEPGEGFVDIYYSNYDQDAELYLSIPVVISEATSRVIPELSQTDIDNFLAIINTARSEAQLCNGISYPAVPALTWSDKLYRASYEHSQDMAISNTFDHLGSGAISDWSGIDLEVPGQSNLQDRLATYEYDWTSISENIAAEAVIDTAQEAVDVWLASTDGHCESLMSASVVEVGMATASDDSSDYVNYWTQNFGKPVGYVDPQAFVNARITTPEGEVIDGVSITATSVMGNAATTSDTLGFANLDLIPNQEYVLKLDKTGYATQISPVKAPANGEEISVDLTMIERGVVPIITAEDGGTVTGINGASVSVQANSFENSSGIPVTGAITVTITPVDVSNSSTLAAFPGEFTGVQDDPDNTVSPIISYGTVEYKFTQNGEELQLVDGATADILIPIYISTYQDGSSIEAGDTIALWSLNETTGIWLQESADPNNSGYGIVVESTESPTGLALQATVDHFTWWNCDVTMNAGTANVTVTSPDVSTGSVLITGAVDESCDIGWRSNNVNTTVAIGNTVSLDVPSSCQVCYQAEWSNSQTEIVSSNLQCNTATPNGTVDINLVLATAGPLNIVANNTNDSLNVNAVIGFTSSRVQLTPTTLESNVIYSIAAGASLPPGISLNMINGTQAELAGVPSQAGNFSAEVIGTDSGGETDSVTINYTIIDPSNTELPVFLEDPETINLTFYGFGVEEINEIDMNLYNIGAQSVNWSMVNGDNFEITPSGIVSYTGTNFGYDAATATVTAVSASGGSAQKQVFLCIGDCSGTTPAPGDYALSVDNYSYFYEGEFFNSFTVRLNQTSPIDISVQYTMREASPGELPSYLTPAVANVDFFEGSDELTISAGSLQGSSEWGVIDNGTVDGGPPFFSDRAFIIEISSPSGIDGVRIQSAIGIATIVDDDGEFLVD